MGRLVGGIGRSRPGASGYGFGVIIPGTAMLLILLVVVYRSATYRLQGSTLRDQDQAVQAIDSLVGAGDQIYVHRTVEILTLLGRSNLNPYVFLDWGADDFAAARRGTSFSALIEEMDAQAPKLVSLSRLRKVYHRAELEKWVQDNYDRIDSFRYEYLYLRR